MNRYLDRYLLTMCSGNYSLEKEAWVADYHHLNSVKITTPLVSILTCKSSVSVLEARDAMLADVHNVNLMILINN